MAFAESRVYRQIEDLFRRLEAVSEGDDSVESAEHIASHFDYVELPLAEITWTLFALLRIAIEHLHPCYQIHCSDGASETSWFKLHPFLTEYADIRH